MAFLNYGGNGISSGDRFALKIMENGSLGLDVSGAGATTSSEYKDNKWHHLVVVVPENAFLTDVNLYVDGILQKDLSFYSNASINTIGTNPLIIGQLYTSGDTRPLIGSLANIRIYNRALPASEVQQLYLVEAEILNIGKTMESNKQIQVPGEVNNSTNGGSSVAGTKGIDLGPGPGVTPEGKTFLKFLMVSSVLIGVAYFVPTIIAFLRRHHYRWPILIINVVFGVTVIGYVIALIWAIWPAPKEHPIQQK
jgi:hypothetical protein